MECYFNYSMTSVSRSFPRHTTLRAKWVLNRPQAIQGNLELLEVRDDLGHFAINHFNPAVSTFRHWFRRIGKIARELWVGFLYFPVIAQITHIKCYINLPLNSLWSTKEHILTEIPIWRNNLRFPWFPWSRNEDRSKFKLSWKYT
jgi:hypothetical protein